jgi:hypothetical protein
VAVVVVERLEAVDVEDDEREALPVARGAVDLLGQAAGEGPAVAHPVSGSFSARNCISSKRRHRGDRRGGLVGEHAQRLQALGRGQQPVLGLVGPDDPHEPPSRSCRG